MSKQARTEAALRAAMGALTEGFPDCAVMLLVAPFNGPPGQRTSYISNGSRADIQALMKEVIFMGSY